MVVREDYTKPRLSLTKGLPQYHLSSFLSAYPGDTTIVCVPMTEASLREKESNVTGHQELRYTSFSSYNSHVSYYILTEAQKS